MTPLHRRRMLSMLAAAPVGCSVFGGGTKRDTAEPTATGPTYGRALGVAMSGHVNEDTQITNWTQTMWTVKYDVIPFLRAFRDAKASSKKPRLGMVYMQYPGMEIGAHTWVLLDKKGAPTDVIGEAAVAKVVAGTGLAADDMRIAGSALAMVPAQLQFINSAATGMRSHVDTLLHDRDVAWPYLVAHGQMTQADYDKSLPDFELGLRIAARYHESAQMQRLEVAATTALATQFMQDGAIEELEEQADEIIAEGNQVLPYPKASDFGMQDGGEMVQMFEQFALNNAWARTHPVKYQYAGGQTSKVPVIAGTPQVASAPTAPTNPTVAPSGAAPTLGGAPRSLAEVKAAGIRMGGDFVRSLPEAQGMIDDYQRAREIVGTVAQGAASAMAGDIGGAVQAAAKLLPPDHIVGVSLETIGSAMRGDIRGVIAGIGKLTKNSKVLAKARDRLARFENLKPIVEAGMDMAKRGAAAAG